MSRVGAPVLGLISVNDVYSLEHLPRLASLVAHHRLHTKADRWLLVLAGDFIAPSVLSSLDGGRRMVAALNALGVTHVVFGNQEDDVPTSELAARVRELQGVWLGSNVRGFPAPVSQDDVVEVGGLRVGLVGVVMNDPAVYRRPPFGGATLDDPNETVQREARRPLTSGCHTVIAITHQWLRDDRRLAETGVVPLILGGHEHDPHLERTTRSTLTKSGMDAVVAAVCTVTLEHPVRVEVHHEAVRSFPPDPSLQRHVDDARAFVQRLAGAELLAAVDTPLTSAGGRSSQVTMGTFVCSWLRRALDADVAVFNGGGLRGSTTHATTFTLGDLMNEVPFDNEVVVATVPGAVLRDALAYSRRLAPQPHGGFLQLDDAAQVGTDGRTLTHAAGQPLDLARVYRVAAPRAHLLGLDRLEPFVRWFDAHPERVRPQPTQRFVVFQRVAGAGGFEVSFSVLSNAPAVEPCAVLIGVRLDAPALTAMTAGALPSPGLDAAEPQPQAERYQRADARDQDHRGAGRRTKRPLRQLEQHRTGRPATTASGCTSQMSEVRCRVCGWLAACTASAVGLWLMAMSMGRPKAASMPTEASPPPAKRSMTRPRCMGRAPGAWSGTPAHDRGGRDARQDARQGRPLTAHRRAGRLRP